MADTGNNTIRKGVFTAYGPTNVVAYSQPAMDGQLVVTLLPPEANGQWRFPWEPGWHNSGEVVSNLVTGELSRQLSQSVGLSDALQQL